MVGESTPVEGEEAVVEVVEAAVEVPEIEEVPEAEAAVEEIVVEEPVKTPDYPEPAAVEAVDVVPPAAAAPDVPSGTTLKVSACVYSSMRKNSASVAVLQKRLSDVGYGFVRADLKGWFHDNTRAALARWQSDNGLDATGVCDFEDMQYLFDGTDVVLVP